MTSRTSDLRKFSIVPVENRLCGISAVLFGFVIFCSAVSAAEKVTVTNIDGLKIGGMLKSWSADKLTVESGSSQEIAQTNVRSLSFEHLTRKFT